MRPVTPPEERGWIWTLRAQIILGIALAPVAVAAIALPWGLIKVMGAPDPDRETTGTVVDTAFGGRATCVAIVEFSVDGRTYRTRSNENSRYVCDAGTGGEEVVHYESADPDEAYAGDRSTRDDGSQIVGIGLGALAVAVLPALAAALDRGVDARRQRAAR